MIFKDWKQIISNRSKAKQLDTEYQELLREEEKLNSEVNKLSDPDYVARYAREKFLYSLPDEIIIRKSEN
ncbi:MAG: septum formation initiator family protein [Bacilli bacterium]|nr:septum formation initiator family protein [Bacilli bacterium]